MLFAVRFDDHADRLGVRLQHLQAHVDWLDAHRDQVLVGGSLRHAPHDVQPVGGLWIVEADSKAAVDALMQTDPFWVHGLRARCEILAWSKSHPERKTLV